MLHLQNIDNEFCLRVIHQKQSLIGRLYWCDQFDLLTSLLTLKCEMIDFIIGPKFMGNK